MKTISAVLQFGAAVTALFLLAGCQSVSTTATRDIGAPTLTSVDPAQVQILRTEPIRAHVRLGQIRAETASPGVAVEKIEKALCKKGAALGADAVVVVHDTTEVTGAQVVGGWFDRTIEKTEGRVVVGVAIKYQ